MGSSYVMCFNPSKGKGFYQGNHVATEQRHGKPKQKMFVA